MAVTAADRPERDRTGPGEPLRPPINPAIDRLGSYAWRLIGMGIVGWVLVVLLIRLRLVVIPVLIAILLTVLLVPVAKLQKDRGAPPALATATTFIAFLGLLGLIGWLVVPRFIDELAQLGPTISEAIDDIQQWIREEKPFGIGPQQVQDLRAQAGDVAGRALSSGGGLVVSSAVLVLEVVAGLLLALVLAFFFVKDGERFQRFFLRRIRPERRDLARRLAHRGWSTLGGYLRGSAILGLVEGTIIGIAIALVGGALALPVGVITFFAAFVPFVGAIVAGILAVLVTLATQGLVDALIIAAVALVVQQLDGDVLAPYVFGKQLSLHPVAILLAITAGGALAGLAGAFFAVPVTAVVWNVVSEARGDHLLDVMAGTDGPADDDDPASVPAADRD